MALNLKGTSLKGVRMGAAEEAPMLLTFNTVTSGNEEIGIGLAGVVNAVIDWGDTNTDPVVGTDPVWTMHTYAAPGTYQISITGTADGFGLPANKGTLEIEALISVNSWGDIGQGLTSLNNAFSRAYNLTSVPSTLPTSVTNTANMFEKALIFNQDIGVWNTSAVTNMDEMFLDAAVFNQNLSGWNVSNLYSAPVEPTDFSTGSALTGPNKPIW